MRNRNLLIGFLSLIITSLSGCAHIGDSNKVSVPSTHGKNLPPLRTPPGMNIAFNTLYPLPHNDYSTEVKQVNISPPGLYPPKNSGINLTQTGEVPKRS